MKNKSNLKFQKNQTINFSILIRNNQTLFKSYKNDIKNILQIPEA